MSIIYGKAGAETGIPRCPKNFAPVGLSESADPEGAFKWTGSRWEVEDPPRTRSSTSVHVEKSQGGKIDLVMLGWLEDGCLEGITLVLKMTGDRQHIEDRRLTSSLCPYGATGVAGMAIPTRRSLQALKDPAAQQMAHGWTADVFLRRT